MLWIGLTGGIASGKSTVTGLLRSKGFVVIDADVLAREVVQIGTEGHRLVTEAFGPESILENGQLNRKKIGEIVFRDPAKLDVLERIIHPRVRELAQKRREETRALGHRAAFYDVPLLFEKSMESLFDRILVVACPPEVQLARLTARDAMSREEAERRLKAQIPLVQKIGRAHDVIHNDGDLAALERAVDLYIAKLKLA